MAYTEAVLRRALARLERRRQSRERALEALTQEIYVQLPELRTLDRSIASAAPKVLAAALRHGEDPHEALVGIRGESDRLRARRAQLLQRAGIAPETLEDTPFCPLCQDSGWRGALMCGCLKALCTEEQLAELSVLLDLGEQRFSLFRLDYYDTTPLPGYLRNPRENMAFILEFCRHYAAHFHKGGIRNLFFHGTPGLGKTFLSACIAREVSEQGYSVVYDSAVHILAQFEEQKFSRDLDESRLARDLTRRYLRCDLLILDDLGSELTTPFVQSALYQLLNTRLVEGRCTIISSNTSPEEMRGRYSAQILSRLEGEFESLPFYGSDIRSKKKR